jgi:hypothetical protein
VALRRRRTRKPATQRIAAVANPALPISGALVPEWGEGGGPEEGEGRGPGQPRIQTRAFATWGVKKSANRAKRMSFFKLRPFLRLYG